MIPKSKISHTILEYGKSLILKLPPDHTKEELEATMDMVVTCWNAVVMDGWENSIELETQLLSTMQAMPKFMQLEVKRLIKRKKKKFSHDPRSVGHYGVREKDSEFVFWCDARLNLEKAPAGKNIH